MLDNLSAHKSPEVQKWLAKPRQARWHLYFTPTSSSWLNLVEGWFAQLTNKRLRTGSFNSVDALTEATDVWISHWNDDPKPFIWTKTANDIIAKVKRGRAALTHHTQIRDAPPGSTCRSCRGKSAARIMYRQRLRLPRRSIHPPTLDPFGGLSASTHMAIVVATIGQRAGAGLSAFRCK